MKKYFTKIKSLFSELFSKSKRSFSVGNDEGKKLYVGNLPYRVKVDGTPKVIRNDDLRNLFEGHGVSVLDAHCIMDRETKQPKGFGFVRVADIDFERALELNGTSFEGRNLKVNEAREREQR